MARANKQLRRQHRKQKKQHRSRLPLESIAGENSALPAGVKLLSYQITAEPLDRSDEAVPDLLDALRDIREQLFDDCHDNPRAAIPVLERLLERFPNAPMLLNWLSVSLGRVGDFEAVKRVALRNFEANPNYLFARINYAQMCLEDGDLQAVEEILDKKFDLKMLYPERDIFHLSEFRAFSHLMVSYWIRKGEFGAARMLFDTLEELEPDSEITCSLRRAVRGSYLLELAQKLAKNTLRSGRLPRR